MKILFFIDSLQSGGKERRMTELLKALKLEEDVQFELVLMDKEIHYKEVLTLDITIHYLVRKTKKDLSVFKKFYNICKDYKPDIIHCWNSMTAIIAAPTSTLLKIKLINGMVVDTPVKKNISNPAWFRAKLTFPFSDIIIGNSNAGLAAYGTPLKKSLCIYNGMQLGRFKNLKDRERVLTEIFGDPSDEIFTVGMVAAFEDRKDYKTLVNVASSLAKNDPVRFVLIGNGKNFDYIKKSIPRSLSDKILLLGKRSDVESIIQIFNVGVLLTNTKLHGEGISNSIIEYMALAKPVIATRGGGTDEVVINNKTGYLIDPDNAAQLSEKIRILMRDRVLSENLGKNGYNLVQEKFDLKIMTQNYIAAYQELLKEKEN